MFRSENFGLHLTINFGFLVIAGALVSNNLVGSQGLAEVFPQDPEPIPDESTKAIDEEIQLFFYKQLRPGLNPESCLNFQGFWGSKLLNGCLMV